MSESHYESATPYQGNSPADSRSPSPADVINRVSSHSDVSSVEPESADVDEESYIYAKPKGVACPINFHAFVRLQPFQLFPKQTKYQKTFREIETHAEKRALDVYDSFFKELPPIQVGYGATVSAWNKCFETMFQDYPEWKPLFTTSHVIFDEDWSTTGIVSYGRQADAWVIVFNKKLMGLVSNKLRDWNHKVEEKNIYQLYQHVLQDIALSCEFDVEKVLDIRVRRNAALQSGEAIRMEAASGDNYANIVNRKINNFINTCDATDRLIATYKTEKEIGKSIIIKHIAESFRDAIYDGERYLDEPRSSFPPYSSFMTECANDRDLPKSRNPNKLIIDVDALQKPPKSDNSNGNPNKNSKSGKPKSGNNANVNNVSADKAKVVDNKDHNLYETINNVLMNFTKE